jgi:DNA helicase II / ATP-dependent DNA helicase PcrA
LGLCVYPFLTPRYLAWSFLGSFTLSEVARAQIRALVHHQYLASDQPQTIPQPTEAWQEAIKLKQAEEYRLLYVAMTRAKRLLWMSAAELGPFRWSVFQADKPESLQQKKPCPVLPALALHLRNLKEKS